MKKTVPAYIGLLPFIAAPEGNYAKLYERVRRLYETKYWCAGSTSAAYRQIYRRLSAGWDTASSIWELKPNAVRRQSPEFDAHLRCGRSAIEKTSLTFFNVVDREIHEKRVHFIIRPDAVDGAVATLSAIISLHSGIDPDPAPRIAHLYASGVLATINSAIQSPWLRFTTTYVPLPEEEEPDGEENDEALAVASADEGDA